MSWSGLPEKLENRIIPEPNSGCWIWIGPLRDKKEGYGGAMWAGRAWRTHRLVYTLLKAPVPSELTIDHLCRNRICCNPDHLEVVTRRVNVERGEGVAPKNFVKTHCPQGHEYTEENTYVWRDQRFCRACHKTYSNNYARRNKK
jgi:HNH endonuclease